MLKLMVPIDGSVHSARVVEYLVRLGGEVTGGLEIHLLNVQSPLPSLAASALGQARVDQHHHEEGIKALAAARAALDKAAVRHEIHIGVGEPAETIVRFAQEKHADQIVMGARGLGAVSAALLGSVATKVIHLSTCNVLLVK